MPKKNSKPPAGISWKTVFGILGSIAVLVGAIVSGLDFINYLREGYHQFLWLGLAVFGVIWLIILWLLFKQRNVYGILWLAVTVLAGVVVWSGWQTYNTTLEAKVVVLVAQFDGPEEKYGLHDQIMEDIRQATKGYNDTVIIEGKEVVTAGQGSEYARQLGKKAKADLVIWAWYRPTENPNITIHIENLSPSVLETLKESEIYHAEASLTQLESFEIQKQLGVEAKTLISFLTGLLRYQAGDFQIALERFENVLQERDKSIYINLSDLYYYLGYIYSQLGELDKSIASFEEILNINTNKDYLANVYYNLGVDYNSQGLHEKAVLMYSQAIELNPTYIEAYINRGIIYRILGQNDNAILDYDSALRLEPNLFIAYNNRGVAHNNLMQNDLAIQDFNRVIKINPQFVGAYINRGTTYSDLKQYNLALKDYNRALEINPQSAAAYNNRGLIYKDLDQYSLALQDYDKAIEINPQFADAYYNRGLVYGLLGQYDNSLKDMDKAIELMPQLAQAYQFRGLTYGVLGQYDRAILELDKAIEINPEFADAFHSRSLMYEALGKTAEAEADFKKYEELTGEKP